MNLTVSSYITSAGLQAVTSAGVHGPYFAIKYFLPIYDYRIDKTISRGESNLTSALSISSLNLVSANSNTLFGEKIFANGTYTLSDNKFLYWQSSMGSISAGTNLNVPSPQSVTTDVILESGKPISIVVSGTNFTSPSPGFFNISGANLISGTNLSTFNPLTATAQPLSAFYRVTSYSPIANGLTSASGEFKCRIPPNPGSFKFNGIALYAVKVDGNGFDDYGNGTSFAFNPVLFGVVLFDQAQYKQDSDGGINDFEISVDLGFDWDTVSPGVSGTPVYIETNYWKKLPTATTTSAYGLNYDGDVVISSSAVAGSWMPRAKLTVTDNQKQQLRLANDNTRFTDFQTIRFPNNLIGPTPNYNDRAVLSVDTSCPDDALIQLGYNTSAVGIKSVAIGCYSSAMGYLEGSIEDFGDQVPVDLSAVKNTTGGYTFALGVKNLAAGFSSIATGYKTSAIGYLNFAGGDASIASYNYFNPSDVIDNNDPRNGLNFAYGRYTSAIARTFEVSDFDYLPGGLLADDESYGSNIAFGVKTLVNGGLAFAHGSYVSALGVASIGLGYQNIAQGHFSLVGGLRSVANSDLSFVYGADILATSPFCFGYGRNILLGNGIYSSTFNIGIGQNVSSTNYHGIAIGTNAISNGMNALAIGQNYAENTNELKAFYKYTIATGINSIAIGQATSATENESIVIGHNSLASGISSMVFGHTSISNGQNSLATGYLTSALGNRSLAGNYQTKALGDDSTALGYLTLALGNRSLAIGENTSAIGASTLAGGFMSSAVGNYSLAFGKYAKTFYESTIALGENSNALFPRSVAIGYGASTTEQNQTVIGSCNGPTSIKGTSIIIGADCNSIVSIPGLSQFNDSISVYFYFEEPGDNANIGTGRTLIFTLGKSRQIRTITMRETSHNSNKFNVTQIDGNKDFYISVGDIKYKIQAGSTITFARQILQSTTTISYNIIITYDKNLNQIVFLGSKIDNPESSETFNLTYNDVVSKMILVGVTDGENHAQDYYNFYWLPNINIISSHINYDKIDTDVGTQLYTMANVGDGMCSFNLYNRTRTGTGQEESRITLTGLSNWNHSEVTRYVKNSGGSGVIMTGNFMNSGNMSVCTGLAIETVN